MPRTGRCDLAGGHRADARDRGAGWRSARLRAGSWRRCCGVLCLQVAIGFAVGAAAALAVGRVLWDPLFGVTGHDPRILALSAVILALCAATAAAIPAARASRIDPIRALRVE